jgi:copper chaperone CopZ
VTTISPYLHILDGRLRIKLPQVKGAPQRALAVEQLLLGLDGVTDVTANPITGNVLVLFPAAVIGQHDIITALQKTGYLSDDHAAAQGRTSLTSMIVQSVIELALERLVLRLI